MTDFLTRMARRTLGNTPAIKPVILPRFAAEPFAPPNAFRAPDPPEDEHPIENGKPTRVADTMPAHTAQTASQREITSIPAATERQPAQYRNEQRTHTTQHLKFTDNEPIPVSQFRSEPSPVDPQPHHDEPATDPVAIPAPPLRVAGQTLHPDAPEPKRDGPLVDYIQARPEPRSSKQVGSAEPPEAPFAHPFDPATEPFVTHNRFKGDPPSEPTVKVTIGRIEVRAVHNDPPQPVKPPKPRYRPTLSLTDYLEQRQQGKR